MIGILGGMGTQAGLDFCNKLAILNRGKIDQEYPLFLLYNKSKYLADQNLLVSILKIYLINLQINLNAKAENGSLLSIIGFVVINAEDQSKINSRGKTLTIYAL